MRAPLIPGTGDVDPPSRSVRIVPGEQVAIHWLDLAEDLAPAQAAAAARLILAEASAAPLADMHVAVGRPEGGLTPVALAPVADMAEWTMSDPDIVIPSSLLLVPPEEGLVRHGLDHRGRRAGVQHRAGAGRAGGGRGADPNARRGRV